MEKKLTRYSDGMFFIEVNRLMKKGNLSESIKREFEDEFQGEFGEYVATEIETVENEDTAETEDMVENEVDLVAEEIVNVEEFNNSDVDSIDDASHNLNDEHRKIVE